jgi:arsenate reductase (thioredoxin)
MKALIICSGNTCRSQMAEGFLKSFDPALKVYSAGTNAGSDINSYTLEVMKEEGIDISKQHPKNIDQFLSTDFDYVITVCDSAEKACPYFAGQVKNRLHFKFDSPVDAKGTETEILNEYRRVRDQIKNRFYHFYKEEIRQ